MKELSLQYEQLLKLILLLKKDTRLKELCSLEFWKEK